MTLSYYPHPSSTPVFLFLFPVPSIDLVDLLFILPCMIYGFELSMQRLLSIPSSLEVLLEEVHHVRVCISVLFLAFLALELMISETQALQIDFDLRHP